MCAWRRRTQRQQWAMQLIQLSEENCDGTELKSESSMQPTLHSALWYGRRTGARTLQLRALCDSDLTTSRRDGKGGVAKSDGA